MTLPSPKQLLERFGLRPKNSFGQNFLSDPNLTKRIASLTGESGAHVLEIGAGLGALTDELLGRGHRVVAVERDRDLVPALREIFSEPLAEGRLSLLEADAKSLDWGQTFRELSGTVPTSPKESSWVLAGNLPYQITGPLVEGTVQMARQLRAAVFLVQKEVADRLAAPSGSKTYGALSVFVQAQFRVERAFVIKAGAFYPQPRIDSAVVVLTPHQELLCEETPAFRRVVKSAFAARRKTLRNAWKSLAPPDQLASLAERSGVDLDLRGETLDVKQFAQVAAQLERLEEG